MMRSDTMQDTWQVQGTAAARAFLHPMDLPRRARCGVPRTAPARAGAAVAGFVPDALHAAPSQAHA
eukprot:6197657-Pleurochrysis_carterae.AAC.6